MKDELNSAEERLRHKENDLAALQKRNQVGPSLHSCAGSKYNWVVRFEIRIRDGQSCTVPYSRKELRIRGVHSESGFFHPGSWNKGQKDTGSRKRIRNTDLTKNVFLTQKFVTELPEIWSGMFSPDIRSGCFPSRIQGSKKHWIADPDPQHCLLAHYTF
jgi:hypothetical protein